MDGRHPRELDFCIDYEQLATFGFDQKTGFNIRTAVRILIVGQLTRIAERITTAGMHDLLFAIADSGGAVRMLFDGQDVAQISDGLHGEIFGDAGWITRFSKYPSQVEIERSKWAKEQIQKMVGKKDDNVA